MEQKTGLRIDVQPAAEPLTLKNAAGHSGGVAETVGLS